MVMTKRLLISMFVLYSSYFAARSACFAEMYYGQKPPGNVPELYHPDFSFPGELEVDDIILSPDGRMACLVVPNSGATARYDRNLIYYTTKRREKWSPPEKAYFVTNGSIGALPQFSQDGKYLSYLYKGDIYICLKDGCRWTKGEKLSAPINTDKYECGSSFVKSDAFYFAANGRPEGKSNQCDLYYVKRTNNTIGPAINLSNLNTPSSECVLAVDPEEHFIVYTRFTSKNGRGATDLYIGFRQEDGTWSPGYKLPPEINSPGVNNSPRISHDGKYLFFKQTTLGSYESKAFWVSTDLFNEIQPPE